MRGGGAALYRRGSRPSPRRRTDHSEVVSVEVCRGRPGGSSGDRSAYTADATRPLSSSSGTGSRAAEDSDSAQLVFVRNDRLTLDNAHRHRKGDNFHEYAWQAEVR